MLLRLICHLKDDGLVFLILPSRCLIGDQINGQEKFIDLLGCLGFELAEPPHNTPHLAFFILKASSAFHVVVLQSGHADWSQWTNLFLRQSNYPAQNTFFQRFSSSTASNNKVHNKEFTILFDDSQWLKQSKKRRRETSI